jgi:hypothetical protein
MGLDQGAVARVSHRPETAADAADAGSCRPVIGTRIPASTPRTLKRRMIPPDSQPGHLGAEGQALTTHRAYPVTSSLKELARQAPVHHLGERDDVEDRDAWPAKALRRGS